MPTLVMLCGPAFSGKTSLARALRARSFSHVSLDDMLRDRGLEPGAGIAVQEWEGASVDACRAIQTGAQQGHDAVLDDTLSFRFLRERYREVGESAGLRVVLVVLEITPDEVRRRIVENEHTGIRSGIALDVLDAHLESFEWPEYGERAVVLDATRPVEEQVEELRLAGALKKLKP